MTMQYPVTYRSEFEWMMSMSWCVEALLAQMIFIASYTPKKRECEFLEILVDVRDGIKEYNGISYIQNTIYVLSGACNVNVAPLLSNKVQLAPTCNIFLV